MLKLRFDVSQYAPEEIVVKTVDQKLMVSGCWRAEKNKTKIKRKIFKTQKLSMHEIHKIKN